MLEFQLLGVASFSILDNFQGLENREGDGAERLDKQPAAQTFHLAINSIRGWHSRDSLCYGVGAHVAYITAKAKKTTIFCGGPTYNIQHGSQKDQRARLVCL